MKKSDRRTSSLGLPKDSKEAIMRSTSSKHLILRLNPNLSIEWQSLCYFVHEHVLTVHKSPCGGHLAFFPELYREKGDDPCFRHAVMSAACLTLFNASHYYDLYVAAQNHYGSALRSLNATLNSESSAIRDETLAAVLFLGMFDVGVTRQ